ncbi:MAG TPA: hypothetical protein VG276_31630 [Actinomycetes bacterium]|nr:hypothetical protein [Actinomycetes bacterium]
MATGRARPLANDLDAHVREALLLGTPSMRGARETARTLRGWATLHDYDARVSTISIACHPAGLALVSPIGLSRSPIYACQRPAKRGGVA